MSATWTLFVDESGSMSGHPGDTSVVAGLLLPGAPDDERWAGIAARLRNVARPGAWPPHTADRNQPMWQLALALHRGTNHPQRRLAEQLVADLPRPWRLDIDRLVQQATSTEKARWKGLGHLRLGGTQSAVSSMMPPYALKALTGWVDGYHRSMRRIARAAVPDGQQAWALSATAASPRAVLPTGPARSTDPWTAAFQALLHRTHLVLAGCPEAAELHLRVAALSVPSGSGGELMLAGPDLVAMYEQAVEHSAVADARPLTVHSLPQPTPYFDPDVHPGLVLADWWANRSERSTKRPTRWESARRAALQVFGLGPQDPKRPIDVTATWPSSPQGGPTMTSTGQPLADVARALGQSPADPPPHPVPRWTADQAWVGIVRRGVP